MQLISYAMAIVNLRLNFKVFARLLSKRRNGCKI